MQPVDNTGTYIYRQSPLLNRSWMIYLKDKRGELVPVGDYTVLDEEEPSELSEKKLINLVTLLNGGTEVLNLGEETQSRLLFHRKPKQDHADPTQVIFYTFAGAGISRENAILTLDAGVENEH